MTDQGIGNRFQQETKYIRGSMDQRKLSTEAQPEQYRQYPEADTVHLPSFRDLEDKGFSTLLTLRRSVRRFLPEPLTGEELSFLAYACAGIREERNNFLFRTVPSAGALYPVESYIAVHAVMNIPMGIYHYNVKAHCLELIEKGNFRDRTAEAALDQAMCGNAACVFIWTAVFARSAWKYGERAYRYVYLDAGHIGAHLALAAAAVNLGSCQIGALYDEEVNRIVHADGMHESIVYMSAVGRPVH